MSKSKIASFLVGYLSKLDFLMILLAPTFSWDKTKRNFRNPQR